jgi:hypothetical protein
MYDQDQFANHVYSDRGFGRGDNLWQLDSALIRTVFNLNVRDPYVKDDLSWSINDGMDHRLQEGFQRWRATNEQLNLSRARPNSPHTPGAPQTTALWFAQAW